eukprot:105570-Pyramimonas_sp.AAC.1
MIQAVNQAAIHVDTIDAGAGFLPRQGATMGHSLTAGDFIDIYSPALKEWNEQFSCSNSACALLRGGCPISKEAVDIGIGLFVDDVPRVQLHACAPRA